MYTSDDDSIEVASQSPTESDDGSVEVATSDPRADLDQLHVTADKTRLTREVTSKQLENEKREQLKRLNFGIPLPYEMVGERPLPEITFDELKQAWDDGDYFDVIKMSFSILFKKENRVEGLGYFVKGVEKIPDRDKVGVYQQIDQMDQSGLSWQNKMKTSLLNANVEYELYRKGAEIDRVAVREQSDRGVRRIEAGDTLEALVQERNPTDSSIWESMRNGTVLGALEPNDPLPVGSYVYFDEKGFPIFISDRSDENPKIPIFRQTEAVRNKEDNRDSRVEFLKSRLKNGDIVFFSGRSYLNPIKTGFVVMGRMLQASDPDDEGFHAIHAGVWDAEKGVVRHIQGNGYTEETLESVAKHKYGSISVGRLGNPQKAEALLDMVSSDKYSKVREYDYKGVVSRFSSYWKSRIRRDKKKPLEKTRKVPFWRRGPKALTCVDLLRQAAEEVGDNELIGNDNALDMFKSLNIEYSMHLEPQSLS